MSVRPVGRSKRPWNKGLLIGLGTLTGKTKPCNLQIWRSIVNFARATSLNSGWTTFAQDRTCDAEQQLCKRRQDDQSSSRSRSSLGVQLKRGYQRSGRPVRVISFQVAFTTALTYQSANMLGWCIAGLTVSG